MEIADTDLEKIILFYINFKKINLENIILN